MAWEQQIQKDGIIKIGKNKIYQDGELFIVEKFEYVENGKDMFSVYDGYEDLEDAVRVAKRLTPNSTY